MTEGSFVPGFPEAARARLPSGTPEKKPPDFRSAFLHWGKSLGFAQTGKYPPPGLRRCREGSHSGPVLFEEWDQSGLEASVWGSGGTELLDYTCWIFVLLGLLFVFVCVCQYFCIFDKMGNTSFTSPEA